MYELSYHVGAADAFLRRQCADGLVEFCRIAKVGYDLFEVGLGYFHC